MQGDLKKATQWADLQRGHDAGRLVGCGLRESVLLGEMSSWIRHRADVLDFTRTMSYYPMGAQIYPRVGEEQPGGGGVRLQRDVGSRVHASGILRALQ